MYYIASIKEYAVKNFIKSKISSKNKNKTEKVVFQEKIAFQGQLNCTLREDRQKLFEKLANNPDVKELSIANCQITDDALEALEKEWPQHLLLQNLKLLDLSYNMITEAKLLCLGKLMLHFPMLNAVFLDHNQIIKVDENIIKSLIKPTLNILSINYQCEQYDARPYCQILDKKVENIEKLENVLRENTEKYNEHASTMHNAILNFDAAKACVNKEKNNVDFMDHVSCIEALETQMNIGLYFFYLQDNSRLPIETAKVSLSNEKEALLNYFTINMNPHLLENSVYKKLDVSSLINPIRKESTIFQYYTGPKEEKENVNIENKLNIS